MSDINYLSRRGRTEKSEAASLVSSVCCKHPEFKPSAKEGFATARKIGRLLSGTRCRLPRAARPHGETFNFNINRI